MIRQPFLPKRHLAVLLAAFALGALGACVSPTDGCASAADVRGAWRYAATQDAPASAALSGTLTVRSQRCADFDGTLDIVETDARGTTRRLAGPVSGRVVEGHAVHFDLFVGSASREHVGVLAADSVSGTWVELAGAGGAVTGSFRGRREVVP